MLSAYKNRRDANEPEIFQALQECGFQIRPIDTPCDAICAFNGVNYLVEVKNGPKAPLTPTQEAFHRNWTGQIKVLCDATDARAWAQNVAMAHSAGLHLRGEVK